MDVFLRNRFLNSVIAKRLAMGGYITDGRM